MKASRHKILKLFICVVLATSVMGCSGTAENENKQNRNSSILGMLIKKDSEDDKETKTVNETENDNTSDDITDSEQILKDDQDSRDEDTIDDDIYPDDNDGLTLSDTQRNCVNMLNYMSVLTQEINESKGNQLFLESAYSSLVNDIYPNAVDVKTQAQIISLMDTINKYRMIAVKRDRLEYIYEQNRAQALRKAIPNPIGLLSAVQSGNLLKSAVSVLYMAVDSASSYAAAKSQADLQFIKDGWELDDAESAELHSSTKNALNYMLNIIRDYDIPGDYALNAEAIEDLVSWSSKPDSQIAAKLAWFESHKKTYQQFGPYWLELAKNYYNSGDYENCLDAMDQYTAISTRIFRKDLDYANALPMAIISAKETMKKPDYVKTADNYCSIITANIKDSDWSLRYFVAQIYMDLYSQTKDNSYLEKAYTAVFDNVVILIEEQQTLNKTYLEDIKEETARKDATKREKKEVKEYNKLIKKERKIALPPVSEALYLNCDLLFALAKEMDLPASKKNQIDAILHESGNNIFLTQTLDDRFWFGKEPSIINSNEIEMSFDGKKLTLPATCITDRSVITVNVTRPSGTKLFDDWEVTNVKRPKNSECKDFVVTFENERAKDYPYQAGDEVTVKIVPVEESPDKCFEFKYNVIPIKVAIVFDGIKFERVKE